MITINGEDKTEELRNFARFIGLEAAASGRYSILLLLQLLGGYASRGLVPARVVHEILALEGTSRQSNTKPPTPVKRPPLRGLWHKHYMAAGLSAMAINLKNELIKNGLPWLEERVRQAQRSGEEHYLTEEDIDRTVDDAVVGAWVRRLDASELTGEWIIFAKHKGLNYYLCLGDHNGDHSRLRAQIDQVCCAEFPFVTGLLYSA
jgi:hypothetical protein